MFENQVIMSSLNSALTRASLGEENVCERTNSNIEEPCESLENLMNIEDYQNDIENPISSKSLNGK